MRKRNDAFYYFRWKWFYHSSFISQYKKNIVTIGVVFHLSLHWKIVLDIDIELDAEVNADACLLLNLLILSNTFTFTSETIESWTVAIWLSQYVESSLIET